MMRFIFLSMFVLPFCQIVLAEDVLTQNFGQQHLFFSETQVALQYYCNDKPQINWLLESANRKLMSGIAKVHDGIATVEFKTPTLNNGVMLKLKLTVDRQTEPFILLSPIIFQSQKETLKKLNVTLIEGENKHLSKVFKQEGIVFNDDLRKIRPSSLIVITDHEITDEMIRLSEANHVIIVPTLPISMSLPQLNDRTTVIMTKTYLRFFIIPVTNKKKFTKPFYMTFHWETPLYLRCFPVKN